MADSEPIKDNVPAQDPKPVPSTPPPRPTIDKYNDYKQIRNHWDGPIPNALNSESPKITESKPTNDE